MLCKEVIVAYCKVPPSTCLNKLRKTIKIINPDIQIQNNIQIQLLYHRI